MLKELKDAALFAGFEFRPEFICLDFEKGAKKLGNKPHPNPWIFVELIQAEELFMSVRYERIDTGI